MKNLQIANPKGQNKCQNSTKVPVLTIYNKTKKLGDYLIIDLLIVRTMSMYDG